MRTVQSAPDWERAVLAMPQAQVLQSWQWGELKAAWGWEAHRFVWADVAAPLACAQVLIRSVGRLPLRVGYLPRGPLLANAADPVLWNSVLADLEAWARSRRLAVLKMDPAVAADLTPVTALWGLRGWRPSEEQIQFPNTMVSDLSPGEMALWEGLKAKTRYNVRLAERRGVKVSFAGTEALPTFFDLYAATARRNGFAIRSRAYYLDAWSRFLDAGWATVILATRVGQPLAGVIPVAYGPTAWYLYGASADEGREHMPAYLAQWASLEWALARGCRSYDWWGGPTVLAEDDPLWGVYRFKEGFGANWVVQVGAWDYLPRPWLSATFQSLTAVRRRALGLARLRRGAGR